MSDILRDELVNDPLVRGYVAMSNREAADDLNIAYRARNRASMTGRQVKAEVVDTEYDLLSADKKAHFLVLTSSDDLDPFGLDANVIKDIFGAGSMTVTALATARIETVSRGVELGLSRVGEGDVWDVRNGN